MFYKVHIASRQQLVYLKEGRYNLQVDVA